MEKCDNCGKSERNLHGSVGNLCSECMKYMGHIMDPTIINKKDNDFDEEKTNEKMDN